MPGCITHYIFAKDCFDKLENDNLKNILSKNINIFLIGSCGPNFFEYCNNVPNIFSKNLANISNLIHNKNINLFFEKLINYSINNPHIDSLLLYKLKYSIPTDFIKDININLSNNEMLMLCDMYNFLLKYVFNKNISYNDICKSLSTFKKTQIKLVYSSSIYSKLYLFIKNLLCKTGYIENKTYSNHTHCVNDLLNEKKSTWIDPFSKEEYNKSLIDIYYDSEHLYLEIVNIFYQYIQNNKKMMDIINKIENKSYITNQNFNTIYNINL